MCHSGVYLVVTLCGAIGVAEALHLQQPDGGGEPRASGGDPRIAARINSQHILFADPLVKKLFDEKRNISVIVVGANDGSMESNDPMSDALYNINVRALMVEPNPPVFKTLEKNLKKFPESQRLQPLNVAICADKEGVVPFYVVAPSFQSKCPNAPHWAKYQLSSMSYKQVSKHWEIVDCGFQKEEDFQAFIEEIQVPCWTPSHLMGMDAFKPRLIDFLMVDAEGFDDKIVTAFMSQADFEPQLIAYEDGHVAGDAASNLTAMLNKRGYATRRQNAANIIAWRQ